MCSRRSSDLCTGLSVDVPFVTSSTSKGGYADSRKGSNWLRFGLWQTCLAKTLNPLQGFNDFAAWTKSPSFADAHANKPPEGMFAGKSVLTVHEVFLSTDLDGLDA